MKCQLCDRDFELYKHHLIPKQKRGKETIDVCLTCRDAIHQFYSNKELAKKYNTLEKLKEAPKVKKYIEWIKKRPRERFIIKKKKKR